MARATVKCKYLVVGDLESLQRARQSSACVIYPTRYTPAIPSSLVSKLHGHALLVGVEATRVAKVLTPHRELAPEYVWEFRDGTLRGVPAGVSNPVARLNK